MARIIGPLPQRSFAITSWWRKPAHWILASVLTALSLVFLLLALHSGAKDSATGPPKQEAIGAAASAEPTETPTLIVPPAADVTPESSVPPTSPDSSAPSPDSPVPAPDEPAPVLPPVEFSPTVFPAATAPIGLQVEAAGIEVAILPLTPTATDLNGQSIVPPLTEDGYWLTPYGTPGTGSDNTTYVVGHSWEGRDAPFDRFSTNTEIGDIIVLTTATGSIKYRVDSIITYEKASLKATEIWDIVPNRLIIISCYTEDPWGKNVVVTASPATN